MNYAVWVFVVMLVWGGGCVCLGLTDLRLAAEGLPTLSQRVWEGAWLLGVLIVVWLAVGPLFVAGHFWFGWLKP